MGVVWFFPLSHDPDELHVTYAQQQKHIQLLRDQLKTILSDALNR